MTVERKAILARLKETRDEMLRHAAAPAAEIARSYGEGKWTAGELLAHIADCEFINLWRFGRAVAEPGSTVEPFEENDWAQRLDYAHRPVVVSRDLFLGARNALIHGFEMLPDSVLESKCIHAEKGPMPAWRWAKLAVNHCAHHLSQVVAAREQIKWVKVVTPESWEYGGAPKP